MKGLIALVGSGEYLPVMNEVDRYLLAAAHTNGQRPSVVCLPTAAGQEGEASVGRWLRMGNEHFTALGATVHPLLIVDRASADDPRYVPILEQADLIYFSGGNPRYVFETMAGSQAWEAANRAWARAGAYAGCSAGAMMLGRKVPDFRRLGLGGQIDAFGIIPAQFVMPHFDHVGPFRQVVNILRRGLKDGQFILGIDEDTALVGRLAGEWKVMGKSCVHVLTRKASKSYTAGETVPMPGKGS
jgi:cyanophycinase